MKESSRLTSRQQTTILLKNNHPFEKSLKTNSIIIYGNRHIY